MNPTISVVIPTFNYGRFVCEAVESALRQTLQPLEIIVVDDGSTDDTSARLEPFGDRIRHVRQENRGLSAARNAGIRLARGQWIAFLDSDDVWHEQKLERQWLAQQSFPELLGISTESVSFSERAPRAARFPGNPRVKYTWIRDLAWGVTFSGGSRAMIHRDCFECVGGFDESLRAVEDLDMWFRIAARYPIGILREPLTFVRLHSTSMSTRAVSMAENHRRVIEKAFGTLPPLRNKRLWKRVALARMHRGVAWMHFEAQDRSAALLTLWQSMLACPLTSGRSRPLVRLRMALRFIRG